MGYSEKLKELAKKSYNRFINYIRNQRHLLTDENEDENGDIVVIVTYFEENNEDYIGTYIFNEDEELIGWE